MTTDANERTALQYHEFCEPHPTYVAEGLHIAKPEPSTPRRGRADLMRQIAALYAQIAIGSRRAGPPQVNNTERQVLAQQIVVLEQQLMAK